MAEWIVRGASVDGRERDWIGSALRTRSDLLPDVLSSLLEPGSSSGAFLANVEAWAARQTIMSERTASVAAALARIWTARATTRRELLGAATLFRLLVNTQAHDAMAIIDRQLAAQVSSILGQHSEVEELLELFDNIPAEVRWGLKTDLLHPRARPARRLDWEKALSEPFLHYGHEPVSVQEGTRTLFDGLSCSRAVSVDGPLVSVIIPCYRPDSGLLTSVQSLLNQSYRNLEVVVVDDASGGEYAHLFDNCAARDSRVQIVRSHENVGSYCATNLGIEHSRGIYIGTQGSDDWSHPGRIEAHVAVLEKTPSITGVRSRAVRALSDMSLQWIGYPPVRVNVSSLVFRRDALEMIGKFDALRKGADSEFHERMERFGGGIGDLDDVLAIVQLRANSLSRADFAYGWQSPDRVLLRAAYRDWHSRITSSQLMEVSQTLGDPQYRPYPVPASYRGGPRRRQAPYAAQLAICLDASWKRAVDELRKLLNHLNGSRRVVVLHAEDPLLGRGDRPVPLAGFFDVISHANAELGSWSEPLSVDQMVILSGGTIQMPPEFGGSVATPEVNEVLLVARRADVEEPYTDIATESRVVEHLYGKGPRWCAASSTDREAWLRDGWALPLLEEALR